MKDTVYNSLITILFVIGIIASTTGAFKLHAVFGWFITAVWSLLLMYSAYVAQKEGK